MISRLLSPVALFIAVFVSFFVASTGQSFAQEIENKTLLLESATPFFSKTLTLTETETIDITFTQVPGNLSDINGEVILIKGTESYLEMSLGENDSAELTAGEYLLLAYGKLNSGTEASLVLRIGSGGQTLLDEVLTLQDSSASNNALIDIEESFYLEQAASFQFSLNDMDNFDAGNFLQPLQYVAAVISSPEHGLVYSQLLPGGQQAIELLELQPGNYNLLLNVAGTEDGLSGIAWSLSGGDIRFNESRVIDDTVPDTDTVGDYVGNITLPEAGLYDIKVASLLGDSDIDYQIGLVKGQASFSFGKADPGLIGLALSGTYQLRISYPAGQTAALGIRIETSGTEEVVYSNVFATGNARLAVSFDLNQAVTGRVRLTDLEFLNLMAATEFVITDGAARVLEFSYQPGEQALPELPRGKYFLVADASSLGDSLLNIRLLDQNDNLLLNTNFYQGTHHYLETNLDLSAGTYRFSLKDHGFPGLATTLGMGLFNNRDLVQKSSCSAPRT